MTARVNKHLAEKILEQEDKRARSKAKRVLEKGGDDDFGPAETITEDVQPSEKGLLGDMRFAKLFQDEDFNVDETSREFQSLNPSTKPERGLTAVEEEAIGEISSSHDSASSSDGEIRLKESGECPHRHTKGLDTDPRCTSHRHGNPERSAINHLDPGPRSRNLALPNVVVQLWGKSRLHSRQSGRANRKRSRLPFLTERGTGEAQVAMYFEVYRSDEPQVLHIIAVHSTLILAERLRADVLYN